MRWLFEPHDAPRTCSRERVRSRAGQRNKMMRRRRRVALARLGTISIAWFLTYRTSYPQEVDVAVREALVYDIDGTLSSRNLQLDRVPSKS